jgi:hypothetical protein
MLASGVALLREAARSQQASVIVPEPDEHLANDRRIVHDKIGDALYRRETDLRYRMKSACQHLSRIFLPIVTEASLCYRGGRPTSFEQIPTIARSPFLIVPQKYLIKVKANRYEVWGNKKVFRLIFFLRIKIIK